VAARSNDEREKKRERQRREKEAETAPAGYFDSPGRTSHEQLAITYDVPVFV
jgi:hypothetical protein